MLSHWKNYFSNVKYRIYFISALLYFSIFPWKADDFFQFIQKRPGISLNDPILDALPAQNHSYLIFGIIYLAVIFLIIRLAKDPQRFTWFAWAFNIETTFRFICIYLIPLNPPFQLIELHDPLAEIFIYGENLAITKDLFFSGHTATMVFVCFFLTNKVEKWIAYGATGILILLLLLQHIHYSIDILGAFFFTGISIFIAKKVLTF